MITETMTANQIVEVYKGDVDKLAAYLPWLEDKSGKSVSSIYAAEGIADNSVSFPVYDSTLMRFVKEAGETVFMDRNYRYVYTRNRLKNYKDEERLIEAASILQMEQLGGILSYYVIGGRTKARLWSDGMNHAIFYKVVKKAKELTDFWTNAQATENRGSL